MSTFSLEQIGVRSINSHVFAGTGSCYIETPAGKRFRISRVRTVKGEVQGRVICGGPGDLKEWEPIPAGSTVELF